MNNSQGNSGPKPDKEINAGDTATYKIESSSHFKRTLVPLDEYAARQGISSDIVEQQGQLGVIQIRKFKGQKFVVDVPVEQLNEFEGEETTATTGTAVKPRSTAASKWVTAGLTAGLIVLIVSVFWLYMDATTRLDNLNADYTTLQNRYNDLTTTNINVKATQDELVDSKAELARIQSRIASSKTELEKIQADLNKSRRNLDTIQSELTSIQGQISLSRVEIEDIQNNLNEGKNDLDKTYRRNAEPASQ
jgi:flagellin-like hook-associated protein FlgL